MTDVTIPAKWLRIAFLAVSAIAAAQPKLSTAGPAESLYLRLRTVHLDASQVYQTRDASLDRGSVHISLDDGTIAFTEAADGHITGALFQGDGELLLSPPNTVERASLALFTGGAILEERFSFAYFRFNDDVLTELKSSLTPATDAAGFLARFGPASADMAVGDALRLLISFKNPDYAASQAGDHFLHAYIQGRRLGAFEIRYDSLQPEPVSVGQHKKAAGTDYFDVWTSFAQRRKKDQQEETDPDAGLSSTRDFDVTQFTIRSEIKPPREITSTATLAITAKRNGSRLLLFELSRLLQVQSVEADGARVEFIHNQAVEGSQLARRGNDSLAVFLADPMKAGTSVRLKISYSGAVLSEAASGLLYVGERGTWYPNVGFAMSSFDMEFRYPVGWTLLAVGRRIELKTEENVQISRWVTERKVPVAGFNLGKYLKKKTQVAGVAVETYATSNVEKGFATPASDPPPPPLFKRPQPSQAAVPTTNLTGRPSPSRNLELVSATAGQAIEFYSQHFGPYPYGSLVLTQFPGTVSQGWPGLIFLSTYAFLSPQELKQLENDSAGRLAAEQVVAHEVAHQWWGDLVTWNGYRDQWVMEALANYSALMLLESKDPSAFRELMQKYRDDLLVKGSDDSVLADAGPVTLGLRLSSSKFPGAYQAISYGRGTWLFHMLRTMLRDAEQNSAGRGAKGGDEPFLRGLREMRKQYEGRAITTAQLLAIFEAQLPKPLWYEGRKSLDWFFGSWLNGTAVPRIELHGLKFMNKDGITLALGTITQDHAPDSLVTAVPLYAVVGGRNVFLRRVFAEGNESSFRVAVPVGTHKLLVDPEQTLLSRVK